LSDRDVDVESGGLDVRHGWIGFRWWFAGSYLVRNGSVGDRVVSRQEEGLWDGEVGV
jgi:hypothetical protein